MKQEEGKRGLYLGSQVKTRVKERLWCPMALVVRRAQTEDWPCNTKGVGGPDKSSFGGAVVTCSWSLKHAYDSSDLAEECGS